MRDLGTILWSDASHLYLDGAVNSQICGTWGASALIYNILHHQLLHSDYVTAWCGFIAEFIHGPFFLFETLTPRGSKKCSITSACYSELLQQQVIPALQEIQCLKTTIFMHDGAAPHNGHQVKALLSAIWR
ncbi:uncharacterized protein TNCT_90991 [Trichonephila clavata]|uniref:Transposase n=1 Tax=Trichonephila clavata TaxID=2740835 RepID=A0A8X6HES7_TRICU|nr:uncharacterized protein TNCT_90991 [Trichonephila clavata]